MSFYNLYSPFIEAPTIRTIEQPAFDGISIDMGTAQGISFRNPLLRQVTILPQINSGRTDFVVDCFNFGFDTPNDSTKPFLDKENWTAEKYLQDPSQFGSPLFLGDYLPNNGALEPLTIRDVAARKGISSPHKIRANICGGNEDSFDGSDLIVSHVLYKKNDDFVPFEDSSSSIGLTVLLGTVLDPKKDKIQPFSDDDLNSKRRFLSEIANNSNLSSLFDGLLDMTGSADDDFRPLNSKASTSGFIYGISNSSLGTDSLAFGGLLR
jgi:hypothetical protein